jgi:hypothetical protein
MIELMPRRPVIVGGPQTLHAIVQRAAPALVKKWDGDEAAVAGVVEAPRGVTVAWIVRETLIVDPRQLGDRVQDPAR